MPDQESADGAPYYQGDTVTVYAGDCLDVMATMPDASVDSVVCDPPYGLEFMGREWDGADGFRRSLNAADASRDSVFGRTSRTAPEYRTTTDSANGNVFQQWCQAWATECLRVLKPGGHLVAFGGTRTYHRLTCGIEDAGFEIRDSIGYGQGHTLAWTYGSGFPKSLDVSKAIDKRPGASRHAEFAVELKQARLAAGFTNSFDVSERVTGKRTGAMANWEKYQFPEARWWPALRDLLRMDGNKWDAVIAEAERAPTGHHSAGLQTGVSGVGGGGQGATRFDDPATGEAQRWEGFGTALKPAWEPIVLARKPLDGTVARNVTTHGVGALNIDGCRIETTDILSFGSRHIGTAHGIYKTQEPKGEGKQDPAGRWPPNVILDEAAADVLDQQSGNRPGFSTQRDVTQNDGAAVVAYGAGLNRIEPGVRFGRGDSGGASRFFPVFRYTAKAPSRERPEVDGIRHPTVKPLEVMRWLVRLVTPPGGLVLDPFAGSGTTAEAAVLEGMRCIAVEREPTYLPLIVARLSKPMLVEFDFEASGQ